MQIIDGFTVNVAKPIDDRMVTNGTASRDSIVYKYNGLRIYDTDSQQPYVWNGLNWVSENTNSVNTEGTTTSGFIPKFGTSTPQITNSIIQEVNNGIKILAGSGTTPAIKLDVVGNIQATGFQGSGNGLSNIQASSIVGQLPVSNLENHALSGSDVYFISAGTSTPEWKKLSDVPSSALPSPAPVLNNGSSSDHYIIFGSTNGTYNYYETTGGDALKFIPSVNGTSVGAQLQIPDGSVTKPSIAFSTNTNTGIYKEGTNILGISVNGSEKLSVSEQGILVKSNVTTSATLKVDNTGSRPFIGLYGQNGAELSGTIGFSGLWNGGPGLRDFIIENFAGYATRTYTQSDSHFDASVATVTNQRRHMINLNDHGQTIIATNVGKIIDTFSGGTASTTSSIFTNGAYGCEIYNSNPSKGHGLHVKSGGGESTVSARFDNGSKTIAYFTDRGLQITSGTETAPSICFDSDRALGFNTGLYLESSKNMAFVAGSKKVLTISDTEIRLPKVGNLAYIFGDDTRIEGTSRTNGLEIYRPTTNQGYAICYFYSDLGGTKTAKAYIYPDGSYYRLSDRRQKENISDITYGLNEVMKLRPVTHTWLNGHSSKVSIGLIAQEVEEVLSELVSTSMDGETDIKALDYNGIIPVLIKSIQELNKKIEILESK